MGKIVLSRNPCFNLLTALNMLQNPATQHGMNGGLQASKELAVPPPAAMTEKDLSGDEHIQQSCSQI